MKRFEYGRLSHFWNDESGYSKVTFTDSSDKYEELKNKNTFVNIANLSAMGWEFRSAEQLYRANEVTCGVSGVNSLKIYHFQRQIDDIGVWKQQENIIESFDPQHYLENKATPKFLGALEVLGNAIDLTPENLIDIFLQYLNIKEIKND